MTTKACRINIYFICFLGGEFFVDKFANPKLAMDNWHNIQYTSKTMTQTLEKYNLDKSNIVYFNFPLRKLLNFKEI